MSESYRLGDVELHARLIIGTGKYRSFEENRRALDASGAEMVTVAVRRVDLQTHETGSLLDQIPPDRFKILPNTAGCYSVKEAVTTAHLGRELLETPLVKLEVIGDSRTLFPDTVATLEAARILVEDGFTVLPYVCDDPVACQRLEARSDRFITRPLRRRTSRRIGGRPPDGGCNLMGYPINKPKNGSWK